MSEVIAWNEEKNQWLIRMRGLAFELVTEAIAAGNVLDDFPHPNPLRSHQRIMVIKVMNRHVAIPYVMDGEVRFLKTMYFSRNLDDAYGE
jgi:hypothetical protein